MYQVVMSLRQYGEKDVQWFVCNDSEEESLTAAVKLSEMFAKVHTRVLKLPDPRPSSKGEFWFFTPQDIYITYHVAKKKD